MGDYRLEVLYQIKITINNKVMILKEGDKIHLEGFTDGGWNNVCVEGVITEIYDTVLEIKFDDEYELNIDLADVDITELRLI